MEWLALDARLEEKKRAKVRRQQRELKRLQKEREARERQQLKLAQRCAEMHAEELLSIAMMHLYAQEEARKERERQREEEMRLFRDVDRVRKRAQALGLPLSTPGLAGHERLVELESRIADREDALKRATAAKQRLDALPAKRSALKRFMTQFMASSLQKKVERAVAEQQCERLLHLFDPVSHVSDNRSASLLNHESANGFTPVLASIFRRKLSVLRRLLEIGASRQTETTWGMTPLLASVLTDDVVAVSLLLEFHVDVQYETTQHVQAVHVAAMKGRVAVLKMLVRSGADVNATTSDTGKTPLIHAVVANQLDAVTTLLALGADKDKQDRSGKSAVDYAAQLRFTHIASLLNSSVSSASLHAQLLADEEDESEGRAGASVMRLASQRRALMLEAAMRNRDVLRLRQLLEDPTFSANYEDRHGNTPLLVMCSAGSCADVLFCLEKRAIPTLQNRLGTNALMAASYRGQFDMLELLMEAGVDLLTRDFKGWDCFRHLNTHDHPDVVAMLTTRCRGSARSHPPAFALQEPLASTEELLRRHDATVSRTPIESPDPPAEPEVSSSNEIPSARASGARSSDRDHSSDSDDSSHCDELSSDGAESDDAALDPTDDPVIRKWRARQHVLKNNRQRRAEFDCERDKILRTAHRGRRNGLVAPLPSDPAGRKKLPLCDNCKRIRARKRCIECDQVLCDKCHARLHELAHRRHHSFEALEALVFVGSELKDAVQARQDASLMHFVANSQQHVASMRKLLLGDAALLDDSRAPVDCRAVDPEIERFERSKRLAREKQVMQAPINVPVAAAKHAARGGDGEIFTDPAELELANLYIVQKKYEKAKALLVQMQLVVTDSLGALHPTVLRIAIGLARVSNETGRPDTGVKTMQSALGLFESILPPEHRDMLLGVSVLLAGLDAQAQFDSAVAVCRHWLRVRTLALGVAHDAVRDLARQLDGFVATRETIRMSVEDQVYLDMVEQDAARAEQHLRDKERRLAEFRRLLLDDPPGLDAFVAFAHREFVDDLVHFWVAVERFKQTGHDPKAFRAAAVHIFLTYIKSRRVKVITAIMRKRIKKTITVPGRKLPATVFDEVQSVVFDVVYTGVYARYLASKRDGVQ